MTTHGCWECEHVSLGAGSMSQRRQCPQTHESELQLIHEGKWFRSAPRLVCRSRMLEGMAYAPRQSRCREQIRVHLSTAPDRLLQNSRRVVKSCVFVAAELCQEIDALIVGRGDGGHDWAIAGKTLPLWWRTTGQCRGTWAAVGDDSASSHHLTGTVLYSWQCVAQCNASCTK